MISFDDFKKVEIRIGQVVSAEKVPETDKLLRLEVDFAEEKPRQVVSGIAEFYPEPKDLIGKKFAFVTNLEPRTIKGLESQAMILGAKDAEIFAIMTPSEDVPNGTIVG